jgi:hypothetical protein
MMMNVRTKYMVDCMASAFNQEGHSVQVSKFPPLKAPTCPNRAESVMVGLASQEIDFWPVSCGWEDLNLLTTLSLNFLTL